MRLLAPISIAFTVLLSSSAYAVTVAELSDFSDDFIAPTDIGALSAGFNTISGSLGTTCVASTTLIADCTSGDQFDFLGYTLAPGAAITAIELVITEFVRTETLLTDDLGFGRFGDFSFTADGVYNLTAGNIVVPGVLAFETQSTTLIGELTLQGTGTIGYSYVATIEVAGPETPVVPLPAGGALTASGLGLLWYGRRRRG